MSGQEKCESHNEFREKMYCMMNRGMQKNWQLTSSGGAGRPNCDLTSETAYECKDSIKIMANVMLSVLEIVFPTEEFLIGFDGMDCWDIVEARGIPNCGSR
ncbi:hypothetical protein JHK85_000617 [Glycine max]|nr:hypothetical protein JHK85_000617 [Glycine max]KAG5087989.1 hypothetical protein JHK86_000601 [Glycine max]